MIEIIEADLSIVAHGIAIIQLMNEYALDPMGGGKGLSEYVKQNLVSELAKRKTAHVILSFIDGKPAGLLIGLEGFSTFACKPLLNILDVMVSLPYRGQGLSKLLFQKADEIAVELGCCKRFYSYRFDRTGWFNHSRDRTNCRLSSSQNIESQQHYW